MTEARAAVFYAEAKPDSKIVSGVKNAVNKWLERVGPKGVENHFVKSHEKVLATFDSDQRKEVFAKEIESWRTAGKRWGVAATVIDTALFAVSTGLAIYGFKNPQKYTGVFENIVNTILEAGPPTNPRKREAYDKTIQNAFTVGNLDEKSHYYVYDEDKNLLGKSIATIPTVPALASLVGLSPGHLLAHLAAGGKEQIGKINAKRHNYVDSGKAAEHAAKIGKAVGDAAKGTANYIGDHPELITKTVQSVQDAKIAKQKAADMALDKEYKDWIAHHPDKTYYDQSGIPMPSKTEYKRQKDADEAAKKANIENQKRNSRNY